MIIGNYSLLSKTTTTESTHSYVNSTIEINDSSSSTIITIIILSVLSVCGWIFMSYALFGRSEAYRTKPDDPHGMSSQTNDYDKGYFSDVVTELD